MCCKCVVNIVMMCFIGGNFNGPEPVSTFMKTQTRIAARIFAEKDRLSFTLDKYCYGEEL